MFTRARGMLHPSSGAPAVLLGLAALLPCVAAPAEVAATGGFVRTTLPGPAGSDDPAQAIAAEAGSVADPVPAGLPVADRVVVRKAERRMYLMHGASVLRSYRIALGLNPVGQKEREGDSRTPEGHYYLTRRNPRSDYFLSIQVSYPNNADLRRARHQGHAPGGSIMIHGLPNELRREPEYYEKRDWTDGCIAVSDADMLEVWLMTPNDVPIDIEP